MSGYPTADTFASLVDEVITMLQGFGVNNDQLCTLSQDITSTDLTFNVNEDGIVSRGIIEIDEELMWVQSSATGLVTIPAWGRGWKGTTKAAHLSGSAVYVSPTYPRSIVSREVNNAIRACYPSLFAVGSQIITYTGDVWQYELDASAERVLAVEWRWDLADGWHRTSGWEATHGVNPLDYPSGKMISIAEPLMAGATVQVRYSKAPTLLSNPTDPFTLTGLPSSARDVVVLGAAARLTPWLDAGRLPVDSVAADALDQLKPVGNAVSVGRELRSLYAKRLNEERDALLARYPIRVHKVR